MSAPLTRIAFAHELAGLGEQTGGELAGRALLGRGDRVLEIGHDEIRLGLERARELPLVGAGGEEQGANGFQRPGRNATVYMSDIRTVSNPLAESPAPAALDGALAGEPARAAPP